MSTPFRLARLGAAAAAAALASIPMASPAAAQPAELLLVQDVVATEAVAPGDVFTYRPIVHNGGSATVAVIHLELFDADYAHHTQRFGNCHYLEDSRAASCQFEIDLAPGETAQVPAETAVELRVLPNAPHGWRVNANYRVDGFDQPIPDPDGASGDGPDLRLDKLPDAQFEGGSEGFANVLFDVGPNPADLAAAGGQITGDVGDVVTLEVGGDNRGPADIGPVFPGEGSDPADAAAVTVTLPAGTRVVEVLEPADEPGPAGSCTPIVDGEPDFERAGAPGATAYRCGAIETAFAAESSWLFRFRVEITGSADATGTVEVTGGPNDPDPANNTAEIVLTVGEGGGGGGLPVTGARTSLLAGVGAVALAVGIGLYLLARRRQDMAEDA